MHMGKTMPRRRGRRRTADAGPAAGSAPKPGFNLSESPLLRLAARRGGAEPFLSPQEFAAGERLRADFERAGLAPSLSARWDRPVGGGAVPSADTGIADFAIDARRRFEKAIGCLAADLAGVTLDICCFLKGMETVEYERRWPPRSAKLMLRAALSVLASHYGFAGSRTARPIVHWGADGYRPAISTSE
jgi:hypothetical protein